jgi:parallel beta-helix repeat protein
MKTQRLRKIGSDVRKVRFVGLLAAAASVLVFVAQPKTAHATTLACGATITNNVTLTADVGPCTGTAVTIGANNVTLNLNGFSIIGPSTCGTGSIGVFVPGSSTNDKIIGTLSGGSAGPGTITGFDQGIHLGTPGGATVTQGTLVKHVHVTSNCNVGITMQGSSGNKIRNNTLGANPCIGIFIDNGANNQMVGNAITGSNIPPTPGVCSTDLGGGGVAIEIHIGSGFLVSGNSINSNTNGVVSDGFSPGSTLSANDISGNTQDGVALSGQATITGNQVDANGRDGIAISEENGFVISSNKADSNGRYGVAVGGARGEAAGSNNATKTNHALGNGVLDLFWDGNGTGNTWTSNTCDTETSGLTLCL